MWSALQVHSSKTQEGTSRDSAVFPEEPGQQSHTMEPSSLLIFPYPSKPENDQIGLFSPLNA